MAKLTEIGLLKLKKDIDEAKTTISKLEGGLQTLIDQLEKVWGCSSVEEAEKKLEILKKKNEKLSYTIAEGLAEIEEKYVK